MKIPSYKHLLAIYLALAAAAPSPLLAAIESSQAEENAVSTIRTIYRLQEVKKYLVGFKRIKQTSVELDEAIALLEKNRQELILRLPKITDPQSASGSAGLASFALSIVVADVQSIETELAPEGKLTTADKAQFKEIYDLYKEFGGKLGD